MKTWKKVVSLLLAAALVIPGVDFGTLLQASAAEGDIAVVSEGSGTVVSPGEVAGITFTEESYAVTAGEAIQLTPVITPDDAQDKPLDWRSSNDNYATVDQNGLVTTKDDKNAIGETVTITAEAESGVTGTVKIEIKSPNPVTEIGITVSPDNGKPVKPGETVELTAIVTPDNATKPDVTWTSSNNEWATVDQNGLVTTKRAGAGKTVTITATATDGSNVKKTVEIAIEPIPVDSVTVTVKPGSTTTVTVGTPVELVATVSPDDATNKAISWTSSDTNKATVANGVVTTKAAGTVTITATADGKKDTITITINPAPAIPVTSMTLTPTTATVTAGSSVKLTATVAPANATNQTVTWTSSNNAWATVDATGKVTALAAGAGQTVTITATAAGGVNVTQKATITIPAVVQPPAGNVAVTGITLTPATASVVAGGTVTLKATISPNNATNQTVTWTSSNPAWATVANGVVTTKAAGAGQKVTITAIAAGNTKITKTAVITINKPVAANKKVTSVTVGLKKGSKKTVNAGGKVNLTVTIKPSDATKKDVTWSIDKKDQKYATVSNKGVVTTKKAGAGKKVIVTATAKDGSKKSGTITITIKKVAVKKVTIKGSTSVKAGKKVTLKANVTPKNATNTAVTWSIDKKFKKYASVNKKGVVTTKKAGKGKTIKVTATSKDNKKKKATISIKIKK